MKIKHLDTFAWAWWFSLALRESIWEENIEIIGFSEIDKFAIKTYENRFPNVPNLWSISEIDIDKLPDFDLLTGGFPCQDVSVAGKQSLEWWRTVLVEYLLQILEKKQPKYFVFENVKGLMSKKFTEFRESIFDRIEQAWYWFSYKVLNTKDFGLPQNRERVFIVWELARDTGHFNFPKWQELTTFLKDILEEEVEEKYYMTEKQYNKLSYDNIKRVYEISWISPTLDTMQWWHRQPKVCMGSTQKNAWIIKEISTSLTTAMWTWWWQVPIIFPEIRKLTPIECERLQWFPDNFTSCCSNSQRYKQMWNAVSIPPVKAIFDNLFAFIK